MSFVKGKIIMKCPKCGAHAPNLISEGCPKCGYKPKVRRKRNAEFPRKLWMKLLNGEIMQEIKEKSENYAKLCARLHEQVIDLTLKDKELKQKLRKQISELKDVISQAPYSESNRRALWIINDIEKLLKEEGNEKR